MDVRNAASFTPAAVMRNGEVVGSSGNNGAIYQNGHLTVLPAYSGCTVGASVLGANSRGQAVGWCGSNVALYWANGNVQQLATPQPLNGQQNSWSIATGITDSGFIFGAAGPGSDINPQLARFYSDGRPARLFGPIIGFPGVDSVNSSGHYVFTKAFFGYVPRTAEMGHGETFSALLPNRQTTDAVWINDVGVATGAIYHGDGMSQDWAEGYTDNNGSLTVFSYKDITKDFITPVGIDNSNRVIGNFSYASGATAVFGYAGGTFIPNLSKYITPSGTYSSAYQGVSADGAFVASGTNGTYLITPAR